MTRWRGRLVTLVALCAVMAPLVPAAASAVESLKVRVLSNRADLVSGGDALVEVVLPSGTDPENVRVDVDGRDMTSIFGLRPNGRFMGLVTGLKEGENVLTARASRASDATLTITNHAIGGPVFSGPQVQPWICETEASGLGPAQDEQCNAPTKVEYFYKSTDPTTSGFRSYDPDNPSSDVATTLTDQGVTAPFIVRRETGTANRGIYQIALLYDPKRSFVPWEPQAGWNHKVHYVLGESARPQHRQGTPRPVLGGSYPLAAVNGNVEAEYALSRGWAVATASLNVQGQNTNFVTSAESVMMVKERIVEQFGEIRYTVGYGCSGGGIQQHLIAGAYPGLLDGLLPSCSFPDLLMTNHEATDCSLLQRVYRSASPQLWTVEAQQAAVNGHADIGPCAAWIDVFGFDKVWLDPRIGCLGDEKPGWMYDPTTNPRGTRCTLQDYQVALFGRRSSDGFANRPFDNVGVQYGLRALESGLITAEQFVDVNEKAGGYDIDMNWQPERSTADPFALDAAYRTGAVTQGEQLAKVPIIDLRATSNSEVHTDFQSYATRARLDQANGHHDNQIVWTSAGATFIADEQSIHQAFLLMDRWLTAIEADESTDSLESKVRRNRPAQAVDACWIAGRKITDQATCRATFPYFGNPRTASGAQLADDVLKCQLEPLSRSEYDATFTDEQWARLQVTFPTGVCDYTRPSIGHQPSLPWLTYKAGPGGEQLPPTPAAGR